MAIAKALEIAPMDNQRERMPAFASAKSLSSVPESEALSEDTDLQCVTRRMARIQQTVQ
jgi:hypothetical protein